MSDYSTRVVFRHVVVRVCFTEKNFFFCWKNRGPGSNVSLEDIAEQRNTRPDYHMIFSSPEPVQTRHAKGDVARSKLV